jgi:hypothetical protein
MRSYVELTLNRNDRLYYLAIVSCLFQCQSSDLATVLPRSSRADLPLVRNRT